MSFHTTPQTDMFRALFDALPASLFVVDRDVIIREANETARQLFSDSEMTFLKRRAGEALNCIHATQTALGCGHAAECRECIIRDSVTEAFQGRRVVRRRAKLEWVRNGQITPIYALITASPFLFEGESLGLLVIEDIGEIAELQRLIPICSICKKVRDDKEAWLRIETYMKELWDVDCSHSLCPECLKNELAKLADRR
jgi:PAS domain-containing protein